VVPFIEWLHPGENCISKDGREFQNSASFYNLPLLKYSASLPRPRCSPSGNNFATAIARWLLVGCRRLIYLIHRGRMMTNATIQMMPKTIMSSEVQPSSALIKSLDASNYVRSGFPALS
jgi:hypothetical protein